MKKRYTIVVAGYKMNVISDDSPEDIQETVAALDRGVRTFCARTRSLPLTEAAMLAGLEAYSEKRKAQKRVRELEFELYNEDGEVARLRRELAEIKAAVMALSDEEDAPAPEEAPAEEAGEKKKEKKKRSARGEEAEASPAPTPDKASAEPADDAPDGTEDDGGVGSGYFDRPEERPQQIRMDF